MTATAAPAESLGYAVAFGGVATGIFALLMLVVAGVRGVPWWPDWVASPYAYGYGLHSIHWGSWLLCLWLIRLGRNRAFVLATILVHLAALLVDALVFVLVLVGLVTQVAQQGVLAAAMANLLGAFAAAIFLVFASVTFPALLALDHAPSLLHAAKKAA